jgi:uncharacterized membrane protein YphA (DoxX/SURF4 family)
MSLIRRVARPMIAAMFVVGGIDQLRHPAKQARKVTPFAEKAAPALHLPNDPELLVRANGAAMVGSGALLATGRMPRISAAVLASTLVPTTYVGHPFWEEKDAATRAQQRTAFLKNLAVLGGLLLATVDTEGRPGVAYRMHMVSRGAERKAKATKREAKHAAKAARREAKLAARTAHDALT